MTSLTPDDIEQMRAIITATAEHEQAERDIDDAWLADLRSGSDDRLREIYGTCPTCDGILNTTGKCTNGCYPLPTDDLLWCEVD